MNVMKRLIGQISGTTLTIAQMLEMFRVQNFLPLWVIKYFYLAFISIILFKLLISLHNGGIV